MDLIFRSMSHAAGVEIPPGKHLPWEKSDRKTSHSGRKGSDANAKSLKTTQLLISKFLGFLGSRLIRASDALSSS